MRFPRRGWSAALLLIFTCLPSALMAAEQAFPPTADGVSEVKTLPGGTLLKASRPGRYFDENNRMFSPLFRYISQNRIAMTVPVEAQIEDAAMFFWVAPGEIDKVKGSTAEVEVITLPPRLVASHGARGGYSEANYTAARQRLRDWLETQPDLKATGEPYAVYWHGPFTPWFLRHFEVHLPVERKSPPAE